MRGQETKAQRRPTAWADDLSDAMPEMILSIGLSGRVEFFDSAGSENCKRWTIRFPTRERRTRFDADFDLTLRNCGLESRSGAGMLTGGSIVSARSRKCPCEF